MGTQKLRALDPLLHHQYEDLLHQDNSFVEHLCGLITRSIEPPFTLSIDGVWGSGKTSAMQMLKSKLHERDGGYPLFWFNPWKYQDAESIVLAFLQRLAEEKLSVIDRSVKESLKILGTVGLLGLDTALSALPEKLWDLSLKKIQATGERVETALQKEYEQYQDIIHILENDFRHLVNGISDEYGGKPFIVFLDDLDRCLPEKAIQLLEAIKNLFVVIDARVIFVCGIDTRVAKNFIRQHYHGIEENFAINYFRKIFNITISMPQSRKMYALLLNSIQDLLNWGQGQDEKNARTLANTIAVYGEDAEIISIRKYLNIVQNFYIFRQFNPTYQLAGEHDPVICLLVFKEAWQSLYEELLGKILKYRATQSGKFFRQYLQKNSASQEPGPVQRQFIQQYFLDENAPFSEINIYDLLLDYPTLI